MARRRNDDDEVDFDDEDDQPRKKKKGKGRASRNDDVSFDDEDDEGIPQPSRNDAYTGLLLIAFVCLVSGAVFFYLDSEEVAAIPAMPSLTVPGLGELVKSAPRPSTPVAPTPAPTPAPAPEPMG